MIVSMLLEPLALSARDRPALLAPATLSSGIRSFSGSPEAGLAASLVIEVARGARTEPPGMGKLDPPLGSVNEPTPSLECRPVDCFGIGLSLMACLV